MLELLIVVGFVVVFAGLASLFWMTWATVAWLGFVLCAIGFIVGVPTGFLYHVRLYQALESRDLLPKGWYWRPSPLNNELTDEERKQVMPWFYIGAAGFLVIVVGILALGAAMIRVLIEGQSL
jgi:ABC-type antimicrobial peptide transport system permease subunit